MLIRMEITFPDVPEYHFILMALCRNTFTSFPKFRCEPQSDPGEMPGPEIAFLPAPVAMLNSQNYVILKSGNIFSYFSGPTIFSASETVNELHIHDKDFTSYHYAKIFFKNYTVIRDQGFPALVEPRLSLLNPGLGQKKMDLYHLWTKVADNLPFPLYVGMIKNEIIDFKEIVEKAINQSIRFSLENFSTVVKDISSASQIENVEILKRVILHFVNKNTMHMGNEEIEALIALRNEMENSGFPVSELVF